MKKKDPQGKFLDLQRKQDNFERANSQEELFEAEKPSKKDYSGFFKWIIVLLVFLGLVALAFWFELI